MFAWLLGTQLSCTPCSRNTPSPPDSCAPSALGLLNCRVAEDASGQKIPFLACLVLLSALPAKGNEIPKRKASAPPCQPAFRLVLRPRAPGRVEVLGPPPYCCYPCFPLSAPLSAPLDTWGLTMAFFSGSFPVFLHDLEESGLAQNEQSPLKAFAGPSSTPYEQGAHLGLRGGRLTTCKK